MDSIDSYVANSKTGGPAGEILIRESLQLAFDLLNVHYDVMTSDMQLGKVNPNNYDFIILDPWTWAAKGWKPKPFIRGQEKKIYMLDFFGSDKLKGSNPDFHLPPSRFLTAFKTGEQGESNTFLGYSMNLGINPPKEFEMYAKKNQGVIWGKSVNYLKTHVDFLKQLADIVELHSSCIVPVFKHSNMKWHGSLSKNEWQNLLRESKFMIGLGILFCIHMTICTPLYVICIYFIVEKFLSPLHSNVCFLYLHCITLSNDITSRRNVLLHPHARPILHRGSIAGSVGYGCDISRSRLHQPHIQKQSKKNRRSRQTAKL